MARNEIIEVRIGRQVLWVGAEAYPLQNIARAQTVKVVPNRAAAVGRYLTAVVFWVILGTAAVVAMKQSSRLSSVQGANTLHAAGVGAVRRQHRQADHGAVGAYVLRAGHRDRGYAA